VADSSAPAERRIDWLDYIRLLCAVTVVMTHYVGVVVPNIFGPAKTDLGLITDISHYGHIGLFILFIISGMMITQIVQRQKLSTFVTHRVTRVYPSFVICLTITTLMGIGEVGRMHVGFWQYLANLTTNAPAFGYRPADSSYWTLTVEVTFYAMIIAVAMLGWIRHIQIVVVVWIALTLAILLQSRGSGLGGTFGGDSTVYRSRRGIERRLWQFTIVLIALFVAFSIAAFVFAPSVPAA